MSTSDAPRRSRFNEHARAFWLPVIGVVAVLILALLEPGGEHTTSLAITAVITLTAGAAGHAAGTASRHD